MCGGFAVAARGAHHDAQLRPRENFLMRARALAALAARATGFTTCDPALRTGLHPLVVPLAASTCGKILGLLHWPGQEGGPSVVRTQRQDGNPEKHAATLMLQPCGTPAQYARRLAVEADLAADSTSAEIIAAAAEATTEAGGVPYGAGELAASKMQVPHFLLTRVGPFTDVWEGIVTNQLAKGDQTAALIACERATALNPGWGCCAYLHSTLMGSLGRTDEQRDLALSALEAPFWTLGVPMADVMAAAQLSHVDDLRGLVRAMEDKVRAQQNMPPRTEEELALLRAMDALDEVVRTEGLWDDARDTVAAALREARVPHETLQ